MREQVIYTSIFGGYDRLLDPRVSSDQIDYICFTDSPDLSSDIWQVRTVSPFIDGDPCRSARYYKICAHRYLSDYRYSLYIDGNMRLAGVPDIPALLNGRQIALEPHRKRTCLYEEARICKRLGLDDSGVIDRQTESYRRMGFPENAGLYASYLIARDHNQIQWTSEIWWSHVLLGSRRDQISLPVAFRNIDIQTIPAQIRRQLVTFRRHGKKEG